MGHALYHPIKSVEPPALSVFLRAVIFLVKLGFLEYSEILSEIVLNTKAFVSETLQCCSCRSPSVRHYFEVVSSPYDPHVIFL
jgi:hypothetical protein